MSRTHRAGAVTVFGAGTVLMTAGRVLLDVSRPPENEGTLPAAVSAPARTPPYPPPVAVSGGSPPAAVAVDGPHRLHAAVSAVAATRDGDLTLPQDGNHVGWWPWAPPPGQPEAPSCWPDTSTPWPDSAPSRNSTTSTSAPASR